MGQVDRTLPRQRHERRGNLKDEVAQYVRDRILSGSLKPGEKLDQEGIAVSLEISRLPVREALITLQFEGLVENVPRRGSFVARLEPHDISDHFEMYGLLSGLAAGRAAACDDSKELAEKLHDLSSQMRNAESPETRDHLNVEFHQAINRSGSSNRLRAVLRFLANSMPTYFFAHGDDSSSEWAEGAMDEHDLIVAAIRTKDSRAANEATINHFRRTGQQSIERLRAAGIWDQ